MSLQLTPLHPVPDATARVARAAFPKGNPSLTLRDRLGTICADDDFADLCPGCGHPSEPPWRWALVTIMQLRAHLADRHAAEAVRARMDWQYLLGLDLTDPGFDFSGRSAGRARLLTGSAEDRLLETLWAWGRPQGPLKARGRHRTDATHVLAALRVRSRMALVAETLRAALHARATVAPDGLRARAPLEWCDRYKRWSADTRRPQEQAAREVSRQTVGAEGFRLLEALSAPEAPAGLSDVPQVAARRQTWLRHDDRTPPEASDPCGPGASSQGKPQHALSRATEGLEAPYDPQARSRNKGETTWVGYMAHCSETCADDAIHLMTPTHTTPATVHAAPCTEGIHAGLLQQGLRPRAHLVDAASISAALLVSSRPEQEIALLGPPRLDPRWQANVAGASSLDQCAIAWEHQQMPCPQGQVALGGKERLD